MIMAFALVLNAIMSSLDQTKTVGWMVLAFASLFIIGFAFSWGPVIWLVCSEMFPYRHRGKATGLTTMTNWAFTTVMGGVFPIASSASLSGCFAFFAVAITIGTAVVYFFQVETAKKTILEIDEAYKNHKPQLKRKVW
jgi:SP family sugar:H+ symporter-like MFS transporter